jgi:predicted Zn finger-like uncharacterized protein
MNISCPECTRVYRIDPARIPDDGVRTRCRECDTSFSIAAGMVEHRAGDAVEGLRVPGAEPTAEPVAEPTAQDPDTRARQLARALVSDVKVHHRDRWAESRTAGSLREDFRDEILESWDEYVEQVGEELAKRTPYFRDALNDILAEGERVF